MFIGVSEISTSMGASGAGITTCDDEPMCRHTTVPRSQHAVQNGSQWSRWKLGQPSFCGFSENVTAWQPLSATPVHLGGHELRDPRSGRAPAG